MSIARKYWALLVVGAALLGGIPVALGFRPWDEFGSSERGGAQQRARHERRLESSLADREIRDVRERVVAAIQDPDSKRGEQKFVSSLLAEPLAVHAVLRIGGRKIAQAWSGPTDVGADALQRAVDEIRRSAVLDDMKSATVELDLAYSFKDVTNPKKDLSNVHRGVRGLEVHKGKEILRFAPTELVATNRSFERQLELLGGEKPKAWREEGWKLRTFEAHQILVRLGDEPRGYGMFRGNQVVKQAEVTKQNVEALARRMATFMRENVHEDGRMTYMYFPSTGKESKANNMIRQWMATVCLARIAKERSDPALTQIVDKNIRYNLQKFYSVENDLGVIDYEGKVKLGALALAALALVEHTGRAQYTAEEQALRRTVDHLWKEDGSFQTFYRPAARNDLHNFYPGEALVLWATLYQESNDASLLERIKKSFHYYRDWHRKNLNPAFVPWHTQAYYLVWQKTQDPELRDFILEMNDWLLGVQQVKPAPYLDTVGRFYDPKRPFGPPHASSTGVYLEGLIDAYAMATALGDSKRAENYRRAILLGLRSVMQLEFDDNVDLYYVSRKKILRGGIRTTEYDNSVRIDNVQHNLMAIQKILRVFKEDTYLL